MRCEDNAVKLKNLLSYALLSLTLSFGQPDEKVEINENENNENEINKNVSNKIVSSKNESNENESDENENDENENDENEDDENESDENESDENENNENEINKNVSNKNESNENEMNEDGNDINGECYGSIQIFWNQVGEFRYLTLPFLPVVSNSSNETFNATLFVGSGIGRYFRRAPSRDNWLYLKQCCMLVINKVIVIVWRMWMWNKSTWVYCHYSTLTCTEIECGGAT